MIDKLKGVWDASKFFQSLTECNKLALSEGFRFCRVSGLEGFEEAINTMQTAPAIVAVCDINDGYTELNNTPRTRRVKTVFLAMRHAAEDMDARTECMEIMREIFRQFMSRLFLEKVKLEQNCIYLDPRISFTEIDRYFFSGAACAYFQIAVDVFTDLRVNPDEWSDGAENDIEDSYDVWYIVFNNDNKIPIIKIVREITGLGLAEAKELVENPPQLLISRIKYQLAKQYCQQLEEQGAQTKIVRHGHTL